MAKMVLAMSSPLSFCSIGRANSSISSPLSSYSLPIPLGAVRLQSSHGCISTSYPNLSVVKKKNLTKIRSVAEEETLIPEEQVEEEGGASSSVSVPVSPSDVLAMFFQAEGTMSEAAIPTVTNALQETEGISNLRVQVLEGIASVELKKQTTVQATGVASNLVEIIQGSGFKLQTLNLSFEDDDVS